MARATEPRAPVAGPADALSGARVAIVHDWFQGFHGSERVVEAMQTGVFAAAERVDLYAFHAARDLLPEHMAAAIRGEAALSRLPALRQRGHDPGRWRYLLPYMPHWFASLDLTAYEVVVASSHSCAVNVRPPPEATFACYCYTPMRYAWMPGLEGQRVQGAKARALALIRRRLKERDRAAAQRVQRYATLSTAVQERIARFYGREAEVIHPPVDVDRFAPGERREQGHFLWVHRMVGYKQPLLIAEAFRGLPHRLTMVGVGPLQDEVRAAAPENVTVHGWLERDQLSELFSSCSAFIHVGEEDFGISMVEALAAGLPVIALDRGGARDIVRDGKDGILIPNATVASVRLAIEEVLDRDWDTDALVARSRAFARRRFVDQFTRFMSELRVEGRRD